MKKKLSLGVPSERIEKSIILVRGEKVWLKLRFDRFFELKPPKAIVENGK